MIDYMIGTIKSFEPLKGCGIRRQFLSGNNGLGELNIWE